MMFIFGSFNFNHFYSGHVIWNVVKSIEFKYSSSQPVWPLQDEHKQVVRLKRYISLCGVKRNYKKLLDGCSSVRSMVAVLKKELEDLGVQGHLIYIHLFNDTQIHAMLVIWVLKSGK